MLRLTRFGIWLLAVFLAAGPILAAIAPSPAHVEDLFILSSYDKVSRDLLFLAIAILSIGLVDALEAISSASGAGSRGSVTYYLSILMCLAIIPQIILYSLWSAASIHLTADDARYIPTYVGGSFVSSLAARIALIGSSV